MKTMILLPLAALAACAVGADEPVALNAAEDVALGEALAGKSPGEPVSCVRRQEVSNSRAFGQNMILFDGRGGTVYLNRTASSCPHIRPWHAIRQHSTSSNMCAGELIRVFDPQTGVEYGGCSLGEFTPYRRTS